VLDIDPGTQVPWKKVVEAAKVAKRLLHVAGLDSFVKTTGGKGLHIVAPLVPHAGWKECLEFSRALAEAMVSIDPELFTTAFAKAGRERRILIDYLRNNRTNTSVAAYSTRAKPDAPVSVPLTWAELSPSRTPDRFTIATVPERLARLRSDPWKEYWKTRQTLPRVKAP
jgi:bifunctional non-homologous end joining protein LigD